MSSTTTWFITGTSKGLGLALSKTILSRGDNLVATSRTIDALEHELGRTSSHLLPLSVDLTDEESVRRAIKASVAHFGHVDVIVNSAGYAQQGTIESLSDAELRRNFEINVFAPLRVLRHALPYLRQQRAGHVVNISSIVSFQGGYAGWGSYVATKFALSGLTETLFVELKELGIKTTVVYPGPVRTEFLSAASLALAEHSIADYTEAQASLDLHLDTLAGNQAGDPQKVASLIIDAVLSAEPPLHLFAGKIACELAAQKMSSVAADLDKWKEASIQTDFPG